ncbi:hypothetical protein DM02DRAFT_15322 [Periconia macrospinosa]|uniref:F-box domain-containing protein n=1 Tax=Periconia macrospinosa TaxID=97972 RepID=A0A2V1E717_9PLEO|nr:hypothetical protein DM02DRAFT_15322 [Periconia macrospinosa]
MAQPTPGLVALPQELLLEISRLLPADAILSLKLTHPVLNIALPPLPLLDETLLTECARLAIERLLTPSKSSCVVKRCFICRRWYPSNMFTSSKSPMCASAPPTTETPIPEIVELPPFFCAWHVGRLTRVVQTGPGGRNKWASDLKRMCMHLGCIQGWEDCDCRCDSCGFTEVRTYTRYLNNDSECRRFTFWRKVAVEDKIDPQARTRGLLYAREECQNGELFRKAGTACTGSVINLPVHFQPVVGMKTLDTSPPHFRPVESPFLGPNLFPMASSFLALCVSRIRSLYESRPEDSNPPVPPSCNRSRMSDIPVF